ncbi:hypothetical protein P8452_38120 [Trifolium repens]|nr:hypothetical protein P8452_38120 [Trifolium repens]
MRKGGKIHVSVRILINPDIPEVESFKDSIGVHGIENESKVPLIGECAKPSLEEEFLCSFVAKVTKIIHIQFNANRNKQMNWNNISHSLALQ